MPFELLQRIPTISIALAVVGLMCLPGCTREDDDGPIVNPSIEFRTDSGYTYQSDTVAISDTLLVGVVVRRGNENLRSFMVRSAYDGAAAVTTDSLPFGSDPFEFDKNIILRDVAGTETWMFQVVENDGDVIRRSLTFTVE